MSGQVAQSQQGVFTTPVNGASLDAAVVLSNDNTLRTKYNTHDSDATIHVQSSVLASRPAAGTAGRFWVTTDGFRAYVDTGSVWTEVAYALTTSLASYAPLASPAFTGSISVGSNPASSGPVRIPSGQAVTSRNVANSNDISLIKADGSDRVAIDSGGVGAIFGGLATIPQVRTVSATTASVANSATTNLFTFASLPGAGMFLVVVKQTSGTNPGYGASTVYWDGSVLARINEAGVGLTFGQAAGAYNLTNTSGVTQTFDYCYLRLL